MYPLHYFGLFPPFPRRDAVFVAMSFDSAFDFRWNRVISKAISRIEANGRLLEPLRVDTRKVGDSILTEILSGIAECRLVFADISTVGRVGDMPIRNGNVMYEIGLAHATRLPEEVLLFRSDGDRLPFDTANVRVNTYSPDDAPEEAQNRLAEAILAALQEIDIRKGLAVRKAAESLDYPSWWALAQSQADSTIPHPPAQTMGQAVGNAARASAIRSLLDMGAIRTKYLRVTPEMLEKEDEPSTNLVRYECTEFGKAVLEEGMNRMGLFLPEVQKKLQEHVPQPQQ